MFSFCITHIIDADCELIFFVQVVTIFSVCDLAFFRGILCCCKFNKGSPLDYKSSPSQKRCKFTELHFLRFAFQSETKSKLIYRSSCSQHGVSQKY